MLDTATMMKYFASLIVPLVALSISATAGDRLTLTYQIDWNGIDLAKTRINAELGSGRYKIHMATDTVGVGAWFSDGKSEAEAEGRLTETGPAAERYEVEGTWDGDYYHQIFRFGLDGQLVSREDEIPEEWLEKWPRAEVPEAAQKGPDPLSLLTLLATRPLPVGGDELALRSYDGDVVFDAFFNCPADASVVPPSEGSTSLIRCTLSWTIVEGLRIATEADKREQKARENRNKRRGGGSAARKKAGQRTVKPLVVSLHPSIAGAENTAFSDMSVPTSLDFETRFGRFQIRLIETQVTAG